MITLEQQMRKYAYKSTKGLAEKLVKQHFQKQGYKVYRGSLIHGSVYSEEYPHVANACKVIQQALVYRLGKKYEEFTLNVQRGIPDYIVLHDQKITFVEVKFEHEGVKKHQQASMNLIEEFGIPCMIVRLKKKPYRLRTVVENGERKVMVRQKRFRRKK